MPGGYADADDPEAGADVALDDEPVLAVVADRDGVAARDRVGGRGDEQALRRGAGRAAYGGLQVDAERGRA